MPALHRHHLVGSGHGPPPRPGLSGSQGAFGLPAPALSGTRLSHGATCLPLNCLSPGPCALLPLQQQTLPSPLHATASAAAGARTARTLSILRPQPCPGVQGSLGTPGHFAGKQKTTERSRWLSEQPCARCSSPASWPVLAGPLRTLGQQSMSGLADMPGLVRDGRVAMLGHQYSHLLHGSNAGGWRRRATFILRLPLSIPHRSTLHLRTGTAAKAKGESLDACGYHGPVLASGVTARSASARTPALPSPLSQKGRESPAP